MKPTMTQARKRRAFTIIELLTVMSIIVILIGLMVPALNKVRRYARDVQQKAQFKAINAAVELFNNEFDGYPPSTAVDSMNQPYCGSMKLCEALMGQDLLGFHTSSVFRRDGLDAAGKLPLYPPNIDGMTPTLRDNNLRARKGPFLQAEKRQLPGGCRTFTAPTSVPSSVPALSCATSTRVRCSPAKRPGCRSSTTRRIRPTATTTRTLLQAMTPADSQGNIYNYWDNHALVQLGKPWQATSGTSGGVAAATHKMADPVRFYRNTPEHADHDHDRGPSGRIRSS